MDYTNDADIETLQFEGTGRTLARLKRKGICLHLWICAPQTGPAKCNDCGKTWPSAAHCLEERDELRIQFL